MHLSSEASQFGLNDENLKQNVIVIFHKYCIHFSYWALKVQLVELSGALLELHKLVSQAWHRDGPDNNWRLPKLDFIWWPCFIAFTVSQEFNLCVFQRNDVLCLKGIPRKKYWNSVAQQLFKAYFKPQNV